MNRLKLVRLVFAAAATLACGALFAQQALEIIALRHRTVEQVLPVLQPLLEPGATLSGSRGQLFLRTSAANAADIKRALEAIDRPSRRLQISVRFDDAAERERRAVGASGSISNRGTNVDTHVDITAAGSQRSAGERVDQRLQVLEGGRAFIFGGATGFEVLPRLAGGNVQLEVFYQRGALVGDTTATARLGERVELGGTTAERSRDDRGIAYANRARGTQSRRVWVKVEELN
jgi:hypothetical protein